MDVEKWVKYVRGVCLVRSPEKLQKSNCIFAISTCIIFLAFRVIRVLSISVHLKFEESKI